MVGMAGCSAQSNRYFSSRFLFAVAIDTISKSPKSLYVHWMLLAVGDELFQKFSQKSSRCLTTRVTKLKSLFSTIV